GALASDLRADALATRFRAGFALAFGAGADAVFRPAPSPLPRLRFSAAMANLGIAEARRGAQSRRSTYHSTQQKGIMKESSRQIRSAIRRNRDLWGRSPRCVRRGVQAADRAEQHLSADLPERHVAELVENDEVETGEQVSKPAMACSTALGLEAVDHVDGSKK